MESRSRSFEFTVVGRPALDVDVASFEGVEAISEPSAYRIVLATDLHADALESEILGATATLRWAEGRVVRGVVRAVEWLGTVSGASPARRGRVGVRLVHPLALLSETRRSRVFQDQPAASIVRAVLDAWGLPQRWALTDPHGPWPYCVQHDESDLEFVRRVLAAEGLFFFEERPLGDEDHATLVFGDAAYAYARESPVPRLRPGDVAGALEADGEVLLAVRSRVALAPAALEQRDYNPLNARLDVVARRRAAAGAGVHAFADRLRVVEYLPARGVAAPDERGAEVALEQHRRGASVLSGESTSRSLAPGRVFAIDGHPEGAFEGEIVTTRVALEGRVAELTGEGERVFHCRFDAVRADVAWRPKPAGPRTHHGVDTAVVVGAPDAASGLDFHTDSYGRVRVKFRWGVSEAAPEACSCWLRVAQGWAGPGHGMHFLPRVGMEVLVSFLGGDVNRPLVTGCVPNSSNQPPYPLPGDAAKSGLVTRSTPGGAGSHELTFDDAVGQERVLLRSHKDLDLVAAHDVTTTSGGDQSVRVARDRRVEVGGDRVERVGGDATTTIVGEARFVASADRLVEVQGDARARFAQTWTESVEGASRRDVRGDRSERVGGLAESIFERDSVTRHEGGAVTVVGTPEAPRSLAVHVQGTHAIEATRTIEITSDKSVRIACGESVLVIGPESIVLSSPKIRLEAGSVESLGDAFLVKAEKLGRIEAKKVFVLSSGASLALTADAKIDGGKIKLKANPDASDGPEAVAAPPPATFVRLLDQDGAPLVGARFVVALDDGSERAGVLDEDGRAVVRGIEGSAKIRFPDYPDWQEA